MYIFPERVSFKLWIENEYFNYIIKLKLQPFLIKKTKFYKTKVLRFEGNSNIQ